MALNERVNTKADAPAVATESSLRRLARDDLDAVVQIDASITGRSRRNYFERRLEAALREPPLHVQIGIEQHGNLAGYMLARRLEGEFGRPDPALRLEIVGVKPGSQGRGLGSQLLAMLEAEAKRLDIGELRTQAAWRDHGMLRFLDRSGFQLGRNHVIDCLVQAGRIATNGDDKVLAREHHHLSAEIDYSTSSANDFEALPRDRIDVRSLEPKDVAGMAHIDRAITGRDRGAYFARQLSEVLQDSAIRVSLVAHSDGSVVGFLTAKVDFGDYGRTEPVAVIDTIGVDPRFGGSGIGTALLSQLCVNLDALCVERVETVVAREHVDLLAFLQRAGFAPSERLGFVKHQSPAA
jgi:ribosomal protein S18 acetylase RimI-like enzyme